jgi:hypothetical protein
VQTRKASRLAPDCEILNITIQDRVRVARDDSTNTSDIVLPTFSNLDKAELRFHGN